ncbi:SP family sugar porter-like MFS transporter [Sphingomonas sp. PP-F2F-A104-K0414]|uniref:sugar porter family MFS transporter n=1 Tax=Sphingomonas sp. PP-F2F-A104-K0414 TaxID=2135661 RepID=UPI00104C0135|nr:sugar porter family MFS transporter [Sphingomonas sp. PP-F2F-A104-K0414]TCP96404.1 SP family sugar porter-like MFS transporter [Sphingomonas sp. PP-F2F-A104-K0414]
MHVVDLGGPEKKVDAPIATGAVWLAAAISALGGLLFGYDWVVIGGAKPFYEVAFALDTPWSQAWAVSSALIGCLAGAMVSGVIADRHGRRPALLIAAVIFAVSSIGTALASGFATFVAWRIAGGVAIGMASGLTPLYIAEIAPSGSRGQLVVLNQIAIVVGLLAAQIVNWLIADPVAPGANSADIATSWNGTVGWRWMFAAAAVPAIVFVLGCILIPESPRWLALRGRWDHARAVLARLGGEEHAQLALDDIRSALGAAPRRSLRSVLQEPRFRRVLLIGVGLAVLQQWCGINVIFNYAQEIFAGAGYAVSDTLFNIVITGVVNCVFTLVALRTVERWGRRRLLLVGCTGLSAIYAAVGAGYVMGVQGWPMLLLVVAAIATYAMTLAPVTWVALSEIFPSEARGASMAIATTALWAACFLLTYTFPLLNARAGTGVTFWIYGAICAGGFVFVHRMLPETKGKTLEQIEQDW